MEVFRDISLSIFRERAFHSSPPGYEVVTASCADPASVATYTAPISEIERTAVSDFPFLLVRVMYEQTMSRHTFRSKPDDCIQLCDVLGIDHTGLGMVAHDLGGFHCTGQAGKQGRFGYFLQCAAYKFLWSYDTEGRSTRAIAFTVASSKAGEGFRNFLTTLFSNMNSVSHPLFLPLSAAMQTMTYHEVKIREHYDRIRTIEVASGYRMDNMLISPDEGLQKASDMSKDMSILIRDNAMVLRRVKQWRMATKAFMKIQSEYELRWTEHSVSINDALNLLLSELENMEVEMGYIRVRTETQQMAVRYTISNKVEGPGC